MCFFLEGRELDYYAIKVIWVTEEYPEAAKFIIYIYLIYIESSR